MKNKSPSRHTVTAMFDRIAPTYDRLNKVLSFGIDSLWRKSVKKHLPKKENLILVDLATGTCDQIISLGSTPNIKKFIGIDLSEKMLSLGKKKIDQKGLSKKVQLQLGSALDIPLSPQSVDCVTMSFGIRNVTDPSKCLKEMYRILNNGGQAMILEFSKPTLPVIRGGYLFYLRHILPRIGKILSKDPDAYVYLNKTIEDFPSGQNFLSLMNDTGFIHTKRVSMTLGVVNLYIGQK